MESVPDCVNASNGISCRWELLAMHPAERTHVTTELSIGDGLDANSVLLGHLVANGNVLDFLEVSAGAVTGVEVLALLEEIKRAW